MIRLADFRPIADKEKVVLVYPAGHMKNWNDSRPTTPNQMGVNDVGFFNRMCDYMIANHSVDANRLYDTGIFNGGFMTSKLGYEISNRIAAISLWSQTSNQFPFLLTANPTGQFQRYTSMALLTHLCHLLGD